LVRTTRARPHDALARLGLLLGRDRVLQVEHDHVGREAGDLLERALLVAGHVEHGTHGADGGWCLVHGKSLG